MIPYSLTDNGPEPRMVTLGYSNYLGHPLGCDCPDCRGLAIQEDDEALAALIDR